MELRLDRADDSFAADDVDALADFEWAVAAEAAGREKLLAAAEFVAVAEGRHAIQGMRGGGQPLRRPVDRSLQAPLTRLAVCARAL